MNANLPYIPLMFEHRLIERMIKTTKEQIRLMKFKKDVNPNVVETLVDFLRMYADRCHHGKEEEILFRALEKKKLSDEHKKILNRLIDDHKLARKLTAAMSDANDRYVKGDKGAFGIIQDCMEHLVEMYPTHMNTEDKDFFVPVMSYFSEKEIEDMTKAEYDFDRQFLHMRYELLVLQIEKMME